MTRTQLIIVFFFSVFVIYSQTDSISRKIKIDSLYKFHLIHAFFTESYSTTNYYKGGVGVGSATSRSMFFDFRVGIDGPIKNIGKRGKTLQKVLIADPIAHSECNKAYKVHLRKKRICNSLEFLGYATAIGSAIAVFVGLDNYEDNGVTPALVIGGVGVALSLTDIIVFKKRTDKHMDAFSNSIRQSILTYNQNLISKIK